MSVESVVLLTPDSGAAPAGHDQAMMDLADGKPAAAPSRPDWLPEKFKTVEEMATSYKELESKLGGAKPAATPEATPVVTPPVAPVDALKVAPADPAAAAVATAGLDMAALNAEFATAGTLSDVSMAKLAAAGFDKATVDNYVAGQQALMTAHQADVMTATPGGADRYPAMVEWAKANLSAPQIDAYNAAVSSGNKDTAKLAVAGLGAQFTASVGSEPTLASGRVTPASSDVFESLQQMKVSMSDPRYKNDPAFRPSVAAKLGRSSIM